MNIQVGAADIARAMGFDVTVNWKTGLWEVRSGVEQMLFVGGEYDEEDDVAERFFQQLAREVFLK